MKATHLLRHAFALLIIISTTACADKPANTAEEYDIQANYNKMERMVPMRDGVKLFTAIYTPKDTSKTWPIILYRTPYSIRNYGEDKFPKVKGFGPADNFAKDGYIFVYQDIRGTYKSEGEFEVIRPIRPDKSDPVATDESTDAWDTIDWALKNIPNNNGKVGQWGISYSGWTTVMGMVDPHPALVASSPQASPSDMFIGDDWHHNGAFRPMYAFSWMNYTAQTRKGTKEKRPEPFDYGTPWGYEFFLNAGPTSEYNKTFFGNRIPAWEDFIDHPNYDEFWQRQNALTQLGPVKHAILNVAGWFDAEDFYGPISIYQQIEKNTANNNSSIISGPWLHGGWRGMGGSYLGDIQFDSNTSEQYTRLVNRFFKYYLKGEGSWNTPEAVMFETGANRWHEFQQWPPADVKEKKLYFQPNGKLSFEKPTSANRDEASVYLSDPNKPVPFSMKIVTRVGHTWMIDDQRHAFTRPDVLSFQTDVLSDDVTIAGPILAKLLVSTTGTDSDFFVKLIDVLPGDTPDPEPNPKNVKMGSYQMLVGVEVMRARYRDSFEKPEPMVPGEITPLTFNIWDKFHTFKKGHRIMVQVHSSWFPAYDRNPQQYMDIYQAKDGDYIKAMQKLYHSENAASHLVLPTLDANSNAKTIMSQ